MPVRMTEITPQAPPGAAKICIDVENIVAQTSFDTELKLAKAVPADVPTASREFAQVGLILRKMMPPELKIEETATEPPSIDVSQHEKVPVTFEVLPEASNPVVVTKNETPDRLEVTMDADNESHKAEAISLMPAGNAAVSAPISIADGAGQALTPGPPLTSSVESNIKGVEKSDVPAHERRTDTTRAFTPPQTNAPPMTPDAIRDKPPEPKIQSVSEGFGDSDDVGTVIPDKSQAQRPSPVAAPMAPPLATRLQTPESKILSQISTAISNTSKDTVEIRLDPPELGRVVISITQSDSGLSATVTSEKAEVSDLLRRHAELLSRELSKSGFTEASLEFSHRGHQQKRSPFEEENTSLVAADPDDREAISTIETLLVHQSASLDIRL